MSSVLFPRGRYSTIKIKDLVKDHFSDLMGQQNVRIIQRLELYDYLQYLLITQDLTKVDVELIITKKKFSGYLPGKSFPVFVKEKKECTCNSLNWFKNICTCGAKGNLK